MSAPKAFMSYSWDDDQHKEWVAKLATNLRGNGIETMLDQWHAIPGDQLPEFMERQIRENDYVLIICTPNYRLKSDGRKGGVGYEGDIMTAEVHNQRSHRKFIPVLARGTWEDAAPSWLRGKYCIDLSSPDRYEKNYSDLLATLLGKRQIVPPLQRSLETEKTLEAITTPTPPEPETSDEEQTKALERERMAAEERARLSRLWEKDRADGYIVGKLMLVSELDEAKTIYDEFLNSVPDDGKRHRFAPGYAWISMLVRHKKFKKAYGLLEEISGSAGFEEVSKGTQEPSDDEQEFFVKPGYQKMLNKWIEKQNKLERRD